MSESYIHISTAFEQTPKKPEDPCGDSIWCDRGINGTTLLLADGIGSGIKAHIAAEMAISRMREYMRLGHSLHNTMDVLIHDMERMREPGRPMAALCAVQIRPDGLTSAITWEAPPLILISRGLAAELKPHPVALGGGMAIEFNCYLEHHDSLMLVSDGITQAGLGNGLPLGWGVDGLVRFLNDRLGSGTSAKDLPRLVHRRALDLWKKGGDDCTVAMAYARRGCTINILTGPPESKGQDNVFVKSFMDMPGAKIVCGGASAEMVARELKRKLSMEQELTSQFAPPRYMIDGIDLVTEGAVTLNQACNLLGDSDEMEEDSGVRDLLAMLEGADRVNIFLGKAKNRAYKDISFRQRGVLSRDQVVPVLAEKLRELGKLVLIKSDW